MRLPPTFFPSTHGCAAAGVVLLLLLPETMWCLRLLLLVVLLPWSSSVKRERTPAGTPLISEWFGEVSSAPADAVSSATPTSPLPPCRLIDETDELPATETPATPIQDVTRDKFRRRLHLSEGGTTAWTPCGTEALQHVEKNCRVKVEGETTKVKRSLFSWYHPNDGRPSRDTMFQRARRNALSEEKKQQVREKDNEQHRTAYHQLGDDGKEALAEKKADYRTGYSEEKKQYVLEKDADQHRTAYARLLAEKAEAEAKRREDEEAKRLKKRNDIKKPLQLLNDEWFNLEPLDGYPLPSPAQHFSQRQPVTARILLQPKETDCTTTTKHGGAVVKSAGRNKGWPCRGSVTQDEADSLHVVHEEALDDAQREMSDFGEAIGSCLMCGRRDIGVIRDGAAAGTPTCTHCRQSPKTYCYSNALSIAPPKNTNWLGAPMTHARSLQLLKKLQGATHAELSLLRIATPLISAFRLKLGQFAFRKSAISLANPSLAKAPSLPSARGKIYRR